MTAITLDAAAIERLSAANGEVVVCDSQGRIVGRFWPEFDHSTSPLSAEELRRRKAEPGGRTLQAIMADLKKLP